MFKNKWQIKSLIHAVGLKNKKNWN